MKMAVAPTARAIVIEERSFEHWKAGSSPQRGGSPITPPVAVAADCVRR